MLDGLKKKDAIERTIARAVDEGWWKSTAIEEVRFFIQKGEWGRKAAVRSAVYDAYEAAGLDYRGRKKP